MKASIETLDDAIKQQLEEWAAGDLRTAVNEGIEETAKEAAKRLQQGGTYQERTGKYSKDWTSGPRNRRASAITGLTGYSVYNKKHYQLTHLLEKGHQSRKGRKVSAFEHIGPVNEIVGELAASKIRQKVEGIS